MGWNKKSKTDEKNFKKFLLILEELCLDLQKTPFLLRWKQLMKFSQKEIYKIIIIHLIAALLSIQDEVD